MGPQFQFSFFSELVRSRASELYIPLIDTLGFQVDHTVGKKTRLENDTDIGSRAPEMCLNIKAIDTWLPTLENFSPVKFCCHFPVAVYFFPPCHFNRKQPKSSVAVSTTGLLAYIMPSELKKLREGGRKLQLELPFSNSA